MDKPYEYSVSLMAARHDNLRQMVREFRNMLQEEKRGVNNPITPERGQYTSRFRR